MATPQKIYLSHFSWYLQLKKTWFKIKVQKRLWPNSLIPSTMCHRGTKSKFRPSYKTVLSSRITGGSSKWPEINQKKLQNDVIYYCSVFVFFERNINVNMYIYIYIPLKVLRVKISVFFTVHTYIHEYTHCHIVFFWGQRYSTCTNFGVAYAPCGWWWWWWWWWWRRRWLQAHHNVEKKQCETRKPTSKNQW